MRFQPSISDTRNKEINAAFADPVIKAHLAAVGATAFPGSPGEPRPAAPLTHIAGRAYLGNTNW
jgi:hypothetical protein